MFRRFCALLLCSALIFASGVAHAQDAPILPDFASFHLRPLPLGDWLNQDKITVVSSPHDIGNIEDLFDGNDETLLRSAQVNPQQTTIQFDGPVSLAATRVLISHHSGRWKVEGLVWPPGATTAIKYQLVPWTKATDGQTNEIVFPRNIAVSEITLTVERIGGDNYVHLNNWELLSEVAQNTP